MAVDETDGLKSQLRAWRWLLGFMVVAQLSRLLVPAFFAVSDPVNLLDERTAWAAGPEARLLLADGELRLRAMDAQGRGSIFASRVVPVADAAEMLRVRICLGPDRAAISGIGDHAALLLASLRGGALDFNRSYELWLADVRGGDRCTTDRFARRRGDGPALLQLQLAPLSADHEARESGTVAMRELSVAALEVTSLVESETWRWLRRGMLLLGVALVALRFYRYVPSRSRLFSVSGLLAAAGSVTVAGIVSGCIVSVPLKADIYELMTGGQTLAASGATLGELLLTPYPLGGFSIFTLLHAVLFSAATAALGLAGRRAVPDLLLLGAVTETLQIFVPGRGPGVDDLFVDWTGVAIGAALVFLLRRSKRVRLFLQE